MGDGQAFTPYKGRELNAAESEQAAHEYHQMMELRRSVRDFSDRPVAKKVIESILMTASSAPSGAHKQPWTFVAVSNAALKAKIRAAAEEEEYDNYHGRMNEEWLADLAPFGTDWNKPFLEIAPWLIIVFRRNYELVDGERRQNYYIGESVGIATGMLISAIHQAGLVTLTHTPSPMGFLAKVLERPKNEKPYLLLPVGYPAEGAEVPVLGRKSAEEVIIWHE